jgi:hypothetical protein
MMPTSRIASIFLNGLTGMFLWTVIGCSPPQNNLTDGSQAVQDGDTDIRFAQTAYQAKRFDEAIAFLTSTLNRPSTGC